MVRKIIKPFLWHIFGTWAISHTISSFAPKNLRRMWVFEAFYRGKKAKEGKYPIVFIIK